MESNKFAKRSHGGNFGKRKENLEVGAGRREFAKRLILCSAKQD
jgi:hypothetical protein